MSNILLNIIINVDEARSIILTSKRNDKHFVYDPKYNCFKNQSWCDHNIFGFYPGPCTVYDLITLKKELEEYDKIQSI